jgi:hypothetical protein
MTRWIRNNSNPVYDHYLKDLQKAAKVPYDLTVGKAVDGLSLKGHRLMSLTKVAMIQIILGQLARTACTLQNTHLPG